MKTQNISDKREPEVMVTGEKNIRFQFGDKLDVDRCPCGMYSYGQ